MHEYPHRYTVTAASAVEGDIMVEGAGLPALATNAPAEFDGPGDRWSPETLLVASVADCFILTFRAIARASKLPWHSLACVASGTLDRVDRVSQFTAFTIRATLHVPAGTDEAKARHSLERAEHLCLITNSLKAPVSLETTVETSNVDR